MGLLFHFCLSLSEVLNALGLDLFKVTVLPVTLSLNSIIGAPARISKYCCVWWSHKCNFLYPYFMKEDWFTVEGWLLLFLKVQWDQISYFTVK